MIGETGLRLRPTSARRDTSIHPKIPTNIREPAVAGNVTASKRRRLIAGMFKNASRNRKKMLEYARKYRGAKKALGS